MNASGTMIAEYEIPTPASGARCIVALSNGGLFFTQYDIGAIGEIIFP
jgi:virginiamycin B lyase